MRWPQRGRRVEVAPELPVRAVPPSPVARLTPDAGDLLGFLLVAKVDARRDPSRPNCRSVRCWTSRASGPSTERTWEQILYEHEIDSIIISGDLDRRVL
jgi:hypothetical protein